MKAGLIRMAQAMVQQMKADLIWMVQLKEQMKAGLIWMEQLMTHMKAELLDSEGTVDGTDKGWLDSEGTADGTDESPLDSDGTFYPAPAPAEAAPDVQYYSALSLNVPWLPPRYDYNPAHAPERALAPGCSRHLIEPSRTRS